MGRILHKTELKDFLEKLKQNGELFAPVKTDMLRFQKIDDVKDVCLEGNPFFPLKKFFLPKKEKLLQISKGVAKGIKPEKEKKIIFGARLCDINGLRVLDKLFLEGEYPDENYSQRREDITVIGLNCNEPPSKYCFCESMDLKKVGYDLLFHDRGFDYYIDVRTKKGESLVKNLMKEEFDFPLPKTKKHLQQTDLRGCEDPSFWKKDSELCVSCQRCTILCPTCFCFDLQDNVDTKVNGYRIRTIDSCHSEDFTRVAGDHVFRDTRLKRYRHRVMHKIQFFKEKFDLNMCTGCGRCIEYCHSTIDFVETINKGF